MDAFARPKFNHGVLSIASAYGPLSFWLENLAPGMNPDATWRALMVVGSLATPGLEAAIQRLLVHRDSRIRAWACFALAQIGDEAAVERIRAMNADPSTRVRVHAWQALQVLVGPEESGRHFPIRIPQHESLILISEDSRRMQASLTSLFKGMGYRCVSASTEQETMALALQLTPHAVVTDNQKARDNLSGLNLTWDLTRRQELRETVIFMLTADFIEPIFLWSGGDYFLSKFRSSLDELAHVANEYLHH